MKISFTHTPFEPPKALLNNKVTVGVIRDDGDLEVFAIFAQKDLMSSSQFAQWVNLSVAQLAETLQDDYSAQEFVILEREDVPDVLVLEDGSES